jgi:MraZ protein
VEWRGKERHRAALRAEIEELMASFSPYSERQFALALCGTSETIKLDGEERIMLTETLKTYAGIAEVASFLGVRK